MELTRLLRPDDGLLRPQRTTPSPFSPVPSRRDWFWIARPCASWAVESLDRGGPPGPPSQARPAPVTTLNELPVVCLARIPGMPCVLDDGNVGGTTRLGHLRDAQSCAPCHPSHGPEQEGFCRFHLHSSLIRFASSHFGDLLLSIGAFLDMSMKACYSRGRSFVYGV
jgi:hypothetical protein